MRGQESFENLKIGIDKWVKIVYNVSCQGECDPASEGGVKICADNLCDSGEVTACYGMFGNCTNLKTIDTVFDGTNCWFGSSAFDNCYRLETVRFKHLTIKKAISFAKCYSLSDESVQSVIDGLFDLTGQTAQTLTFHADVGAKLTDEQKAAITDKNWTLVY